MHGIDLGQHWDPAGDKTLLRSEFHLGFHAIPQIDRSRAQALQEGRVHLRAHASKRPDDGGDVSAVELIHNFASLSGQSGNQLGPGLPKLCQAPQGLSDLLQTQSPAPDMQATHLGGLPVLSVVTSQVCTALPS